MKSDKSDMLFGYYYYESLFCMYAHQTVDTVENVFGIKLNV